MINWDLIILLPIVLFLGVGVLGFIIWKEKLKRKTLVYILEIGAFWLLLGFVFFNIVNYITKLISSSLQNSNSTIILVSFLFLGMFLIIIKPLSVWLTSLCKSRKFWIIVTYFSTAIWFILFLILEFSFLTSILLIALFILMASSTSVQILQLNEQFFYRINTLQSVWIQVVFNSFFFLIGYLLFQLNIRSVSDNIWIIPMFLLVLLTVIFVLTIFRKENKANFGPFEEEIFVQLPSISKRTKFLIYLLAFLVTLAFMLANTIYVNLFIFVKLTINNTTNTQIHFWYRAKQIWFTIPLILLTYFINKYILNLIEQKNLLTISVVLLFFIYTIMAFVTNSIALIFLNIFATFIFLNIIFTLFSFIFFWNYRVKNNQMVGYFWASVYLAFFLTKFVEMIFIVKSIGILGDISLAKGVVTTSVDLKLIQSTLTDIIAISFALSATLLLSVILIFNFTNKKMLADFMQHKSAIQNLKVIIKNRIKEKTKTQLDLTKI